MPLNWRPAAIGLCVARPTLEVRYAGALPARPRISNGLSSNSDDADYEKYFTKRLQTGANCAIIKWILLEVGGGKTVLDDETLYQNYLAGDMDGLSTLTERYGDSLTLYLYGYTHNYQDAEDLMIEAFARIIKKRAVIQNGCFKTYLYRTGRNLAINFFHRNRHSGNFSLEDMEKDPESEEILENTLLSNERNQLLHVCMGRIDSELKEVLWLLYFEDMSYAQAAQTLHKKERQIEYLAAKGKKVLRAELEKMGVTGSG